MSSKEEFKVLSNKVPPHDIDAEESALGAMLLNSTSVQIAAEILVPGDFYYEKHGILFESMIDLFGGGDNPSDPVLLASELSATGLLEKIGGRPYISLLMETCPNPDNCEYYANLIKRKSNLRKMIEAGHQVVSGAHKTGDAEELLADLQAVVNNPTLDIAIGGNLVSENDRVDNFFDKLVSRQTGGDFTGLDTGFTHLNRIINGLNQGIYVFGGSPSCGKTTLCVQMAHNVAERNHVPVLYYSLDQSDEDIRIRTISRLSNIENRKLFRGKLEQSGSEIERLSKALNNYRETAEYVYIFGPDYEYSMERMKLTARRVMREMGTEKCFIVVDYLQKVYPKKQYRSDYERMNLVINQMSRIAGDLGSPILLVSEVSRSSYGKKSMRAFKESGRVEYGADVAALLIDQNDLKGESDFGDKINPRETNLFIVKNRNGEKAKVTFDFWLDISKMEETGTGYFDSDDNVD
jgi:replicative DNA helicase